MSYVPREVNPKGRVMSSQGDARRNAMVLPYSSGHSDLKRSDDPKQYLPEKNARLVKTRKPRQNTSSRVRREQSEGVNGYLEQSDRGHFSNSVAVTEPIQREETLASLPLYCVTALSSHFELKPGECLAVLPVASVLQMPRVGFAVSAEDDWTVMARN